MKNATNLIALILLLTVSLSTLAGCGFDSGDLALERDTAVEMPGDKGKALDYNSEILNSKLAPPKGIKTSNLFDERLSNDSQRFDRLEDAVQNLRSELDEVMPSIKNLTAIESDIQDLVGQLKTLVNDQPPAVPVATVPVASSAPAQPTQLQPQDTQVQAPKPQPVAPPPQQPAQTFTPPPSSGNSDVRAVRMSDHAGKTRIVLDSAKKLNYTIDYDAQENLVIVNTNAASLPANLAGLAKKSKAVNTVSSTGESGNASIIFSLSKGSRISTGTLLKPNKDSSNYRYFFDIFY